jgi:hypothetical protein
MLACSVRKRRGAGSNGLGTMSSATPRLFAARAGSAANDSSSQKVHCRESFLDSVQINPLSPRRHAKVARLLYLSNDVVSPSA